MRLNADEDSENYDEIKEKLDGLSGEELFDAINDMAEEDIVQKETENSVDEKASSTLDEIELAQFEKSQIIDLDKDDYREISEESDGNAAREIPESVDDIARHELALRNLIKENSIDDEDDEDFVVDNYHYYDTKAIIENADISHAMIKKAENMFFSDEKTMPYFKDISGGYFKNKDGSEEPGGECYVGFQGGSFEVRLTFLKDRVIRSYCSSCYFTRPDQKSSFYHEPCVHETAAIMLLCSYLDQRDTTDTTDNAAYIFMDQVLAGSPVNRGIIKKSELQNEPLHIEVHLETPRDNDKLYVTFSVGQKRLYKVKDLAYLINGFKGRETQVFGKNTELTLSEDSLDDKSKNILLWLYDELDSYYEMRERLLNSIDGRYSYYYSREDFKFPDSLMLDKDRWDRFFEIENGSTIDYTIKDYSKNNKKDLLLLDGSLNLKLKIAPVTTEQNNKKSFEGILVTSSSTRLFKGKKNIYQLTNDSIIRVSDSDMKITNALCDSCGENGISMRLGRSSLNDFWHLVLPKLREICNVNITDEDYIEKYIVPNPEFSFYLDEQDSVVYGEGIASYGGAKYNIGDWHPENPEVVTEGFRKRSNEEFIYEIFISYLPNYDVDHHLFYCEKDDEGMYELLDHGLKELMELGEVQVTEQFRSLRIRNTVPVNVGVSIKSGIMNLSVESSDMSPDELVDLLYAYRKKSHFYRLKNGDFLNLTDNTTVESLDEMMREMNIPLSEFVKGHMSVPSYRALYFEHMLSQMEDVYANRDSHYRALVRSFKSIEDSDFEVPASLHADLRKYQVEGYEWLRTLDEWNFGGILADEMGLGKTLQAIALILSIKEESTLKIQNENTNELIDQSPANVIEDKETYTEKSSNTSIIICPASLVYNWGEEIKKFAPSLESVLISGNAEERDDMISHIEDYDVAVTSYDLLKRDINLYEGHAFRFAIVDEAQNMKNPTTAAAKSVKLINARTHFALTGTPIENRLSELWSIFDFIMPGYLYDYNTFKDEIETSVTKDQDEDALNRLKRMVAPFILRRQKKDVLKDLPEKLEEVRFSRMEEKQQRLYDAEVTRMKKSLNSKSAEELKHSKIEILAELTRIREICCDPSLLFSNFDGTSAKTEMCMELIKNLIDGDHRTLLFSQFTSMFEILEERLKAEGISYYKITGETPKKKRLELVNEFNKGDVPLFLISLKAGGTGLNLTGADVVIHFDPWWNLAAQNQATDRAHRIGQTKKVTVFKLIVKGTIEEKILELQENKKKLSDDILGDESVSSASLDKDELMALLG